LITPGIIYEDSDVIKNTDFKLELKWSNRILSEKNVKGIIEFDNKIFNINSAKDHKFITNLASKYNGKKIHLFCTEVPSKLSISISKDFKYFWGGYNENNKRLFIASPCNTLEEAENIAYKLLKND
jgi:hypothetical protein